MADALIEGLKKDMGIIGNRIGILCTASLGDTFITCSYMKAFKEETGKTPVLIVRKRQVDIVKMFERGTLECFALDDKYLNSMREYLNRDGSYDDIAERDRTENLIFGHLGGLWSKYKDPDNCPEEFKYPLDEPPVLRLYKSGVLGLSSKAQMSKPDNISKINKQYYINKYQIIPGRTCILFPEASDPLRPTTYLWNYLAELLRALGYRVLFNLSAWTQDKSIYRGDLIEMPLKDSVGVVNLCGHCVSLRSGICDILCSCDANMTIFYLDIYGKRNISIEDWSLRTLYGSTNANEVILNIESLVNDIVQFSDMVE